jgi:hypothetical protein
MPDLSFYGEVTVFQGRGGEQRNVAGSLSPSDHARLVELVNDIKNNTRTTDSGEPCEGMLAEWPIENPTVIYHHLGGGDGTSAGAACFMRIVELLSKYLPREAATA